MSGIHEIRVTHNEGDPVGRDVKKEAVRTLGLTGLTDVRTSKLYRVEGLSEAQAEELAQSLFADPITESYTVDRPTDFDTPHVLEVGYKPGVMNPEVSSIMKAVSALGYTGLVAADSSREYAFFGDVSPKDIDGVTGRFLVNKTVAQVVTEKPETLVFEGQPGVVNTVPIRELNPDGLMDISRDKLFLNIDEMKVVQDYFTTLERDPTDAELEIIAARWSEHCGHKTFDAAVIVDGVEKAPLFTRIKEAAKANFKDLVVSAFVDNSGVIKFYDGQAICGKVETHNSPSAIEPYGGAMTGSGGVFRDVMGTGQGAKTIISTDMFCFAPPDLDESKLPAGTLNPDYLQRRVVQGVRDYGNRMGIPTGNGSIHYHEDFRAKPTVIVGAYGILPESRAEKGEPGIGDLVIAVGGRTGRDGIHGATFSSGEMTDRTVNVNSSAVQIGNAIEEKRMADALLIARDLDLIVAETDCGAAGFESAIGEMGENTGVTIDISLAPTKYPGLDPWEVLLSESQERMVVAVRPEDRDRIMAIFNTYNVEATVLGKFDNSNRFRVFSGDNVVADLDYDFLKNGLPRRVMNAYWEKTVVPEIHPTIPESSEEWVSRFKAVLSHGNVCSKEPVVRQYDHGVQGGNIVPPFGGVNQDGPNDALVIRPILDKPYGMVQSHGMNPILNRIDPYEGTIWTVAEAAANYIAVGGDIYDAAAVGNYIWPFPDEEAMGSLDRSVDAAVDMMHLLELPVISGKDSLSSTYRGKDGEVIKIPPVYTMSIFGRIPDVEKTVTSDIKKPGKSILVLVGRPSYGMAGSVYYDTNDGSTNTFPTVDQKSLPQVFNAVTNAIKNGGVLSCHDVSEGGLATTVAEMCFGGDCGAEIDPAGVNIGMQNFLFSETAGCFVVEVDDFNASQALFTGVPHKILGMTRNEKKIEVRAESQTKYGSKPIFSVATDELKESWQSKMKGIF